MAHRFSNGGEHLTKVRLFHQTTIVGVQAAEDFSSPGVLGLRGGELVLVNGFEGWEADVFGCTKKLDYRSAQFKELNKDGSSPKGRQKL